MTYETKNITFHMIRVKVSSDSRCSRTLPMNVAIESVHRDCERKSCKDWARCREGCASRYKNELKYFMTCLCLYIRA